MRTDVSHRLRHALHAAPPAPLVLLGMFSLHTGSALAVHMFDTVGAAGITWLRLAWTALILLALAGPRIVSALRGARRRDLGGVVILGTVSAAMMVCFSEATARIDLGVATALEFLGPLTVALAAMRGGRQLAWIAAGVVGVVCLTTPWQTEADLAGIGFGLAAGASFALYIILTHRVGGRFGVVPGLALSMTVSALVTAPLGAPAVLAGADWGVLAGTLGVALLFPLVPFVLEMGALRRMSRGAFSTFASLEPAVGLLMGMIVLLQFPQPIQIPGLALVVLAGMGAARDDSRGAAP